MDQQKFMLDLHERITPLGTDEEQKKQIIDIVFWAMEETRRSVTLKCAEIAKKTVEQYENDHGHQTFVYGERSAQAILDKLAE